jgi:hypothetical protein
MNERFYKVVDIFVLVNLKLIYLLGKKKNKQKKSISYYSLEERIQYIRKYANNCCLDSLLIVHLICFIIKYYFYEFKLIKL